MFIQAQTRFYMLKQANAAMHSNPKNYKEMAMVLCMG